MGFDPIYFERHPQRADPGYDVNPIKPVPLTMPSVQYVRRVFEHLPRDMWSYAELVDMTGLHEARLTTALSVLHGSRVVDGPCVCFVAPGPNAYLYRDYVLHGFWLRDGTDAMPSSDGMVGRAVARGLSLIDAPRSSLSATMRQEVWAKSGGRCWYCGDFLTEDAGFHVDHVAPRIHGGTDDLGNLVPACRFCNTSKGALALTAWRQRRGGKPFWFERQGLMP